MVDVAAQVYQQLVLLHRDAPDVFAVVMAKLADDGLVPRHRMFLS